MRLAASRLFAHSSYENITFFAQENGPDIRGNSLLVIAPYKHAGLWVFDDPAVGLKQEPFVSGADNIMDLLSAKIPNAANGFTLIFAAQPFPGAQARFVRGREEHGGTWYTWVDKKVEGWLCPALFKYFPTAPETIYAQARDGKDP